MTQERENYRGRPASLRFEANGINIHYLDWGEGSPKQLVLLHGLTSQAHTWDQFAKEASASYRVIAPDLRGHGETSYAEDGYALAHFAGDLGTLVRYLNLPAFDLVGHSLGALIAIQFTAEFPALVNRLVLVDGGPGLDVEAAREGSTGSFVRPLGFETLEEARAWHRERDPAISNERLEQRVKYGMKQNWAGRWVLRHDPELYWLLEDGSSEFRQDLWEKLAAISCPVLVLRGQESPLLSSDGAQRIADATSNATMVEIPGAGHSIPSDVPDLFRDAVLEFLLA